MTATDRLALDARMRELRHEQHVRLGRLLVWGWGVMGLAGAALGVLLRLCS